MPEVLYKIQIKRVKIQHVLLSHKVGSIKHVLTYLMESSEYLLGSMKEWIGQISFREGRNPRPLSKSRDQTWLPRGSEGMKTNQRTGR